MSKVYAQPDSTLSIADTFHTVTLVHICYHYLVQNYFNPLALLAGVWSIKVFHIMVLPMTLVADIVAGLPCDRKIMPLTTGIVTLLCQTFYTRRIFLVNKRYRWIVFVIVILMLVELASIISATYFGLSVTFFEEFSPYLWLDTGSFSIATVADLVLMIVFVVIVRSSKTAFRDTRRGLDTLARYTVVATLLNTALTLAAAISSITSKQSFIYMAMAIPTTKIYANGVLAFLNLRPSLAETTLGVRTPTFSMSNLKRVFRSGVTGDAGSGDHTQPQHPSSVVIEIKMQTELRSDSSSALDDDSARAGGPSAKHPPVNGRHTQMDV
ncbi:hypothetical protein K466DRAFT_595988 [Polyporus arcularius HHB13444]|uniref:DUF6534 domain-containing protein n=1 Tax=Polyporus arcularius HHB13444 TaxID=1314778 RepID=A0A5C3PZI9_9APHY|nr:hypothetical protein K466DRAFT_595988 [Polyporus arcularius HHB13444]